MALIKSAQVCNLHITHLQSPTTATRPASAGVYVYVSVFVCFGWILIKLVISKLRERLNFNGRRNLYTHIFFSRARISFHGYRKICTIKK